MTRFGLSVLQARVNAAVEAEGIRPFARRAGVGLGAVRSMLDGRDPLFSNAEKIAKALDLDLGFGTVAPRPSPPEPPSAKFAQVPLHEALLAAGEGFVNSTEHVADFLAFRRDWLRQNGVDPANAVLARASGDSMEPMISDGDMLLIDRSKIEPPPISKTDVPSHHAPIFALLDDGHAKVKRLQIINDDLAILVSDNPAYSPQFARIETLTIIGKVLWWGHTVRN